MKYNPLLLIDFYKATHSDQYPPSIGTIASTYTPRLDRLEPSAYEYGDFRICFFGLQGYIKTYLIDYFNENFFNRDEEEVVQEYDRILTATLGEGSYNSDKIRALHRLGYLPIKIYAVPEGMRTAIRVPQCVFVNTHPDFAWLTNTLETSFSAYMWHIQVSAEVGREYHRIVEEYMDTCDNSVRPETLLGDFSMRGQQSVESAITSSAAWLLSFENTATLPAIIWLEDNYNCDSTKETVGRGAISTEHSVMCSNYALDNGDETVFIKKLLTEIYPKQNFSMVSDSYDYSNLVENILSQCKEEILNHEGFIGIRGDSGDPVEIVAGKLYCYAPWVKNKDDAVDQCQVFMKSHEIDKTEKVIVEGENGVYYGCFAFANGTCRFDGLIEKPTVDTFGTVYMLDKIFGHTVNSKGYKILNPKVKVIYGDSITFNRCKEIYSRLKEKGYAINNVSLGVGSFSFMCVENEKGEFFPYTRDTYGIAIKATYGETKEGKPIMIYKQPKDCDWKASQKGCCIVNRDGTSYVDGYTLKEMECASNLLQPVFENGKFVKEYTLKEVRENLRRSMYHGKNYRNS